MAPPKGFIPWNKGLKGIHLSPSTEIKKGQHLSPSTQFKKGHKPKKPIQRGQHIAPQTEFKPKQIPWNKGKEVKSIQQEKHWSFTGGKGSYAKQAQRVRDPVCEICGVLGEWGRKIQVHHRDENRNNNLLTNLQVLCSKCHQNLHKNWLKRKKLSGHSAA